VLVQLVASTVIRMYPSTARTTTATLSEGGTSTTVATFTMGDGRLPLCVACASWAPPGVPDVFPPGGCKLARV
jgi:hypothetical protein